MWATVIAAASAVGAIGAAWFTRTYVKLTREMVAQNRTAVDQTVALVRIESERWAVESAAREEDRQRQRRAILRLEGAYVLAPGAAPHCVLFIQNLGPHDALDVLLVVRDRPNVMFAGDGQHERRIPKLGPGDRRALPVTAAGLNLAMTFYVEWNDGNGERIGEPFDVTFVA